MRVYAVLSSYTISVNKHNLTVYTVKSFQSLKGLIITDLIVQKMLQIDRSVVASKFVTATDGCVYLLSEVIWSNMATGTTPFPYKLATFDDYLKQGTEQIKVQSAKRDNYLWSSIKTYKGFHAQERQL